MYGQLKWTRRKASERYTEYRAPGASYRTKYTFVIACFTSSETGKKDYHLQIHLSGQPLYLSQCPVMYGTLKQCKAEAQRISDEELEFKGY